jgi:Leucine-rich repeat (LRR) protein
MKGIQEYKNLNYIDISTNQIKEITEVAYLRIRVLMISYNKLKELRNLPETLKILEA